MPSVKILVMMPNLAPSKITAAKAFNVLDAVANLEVGRWISRHPVILHHISNSRHLIRRSFYSSLLDGLVMAGTLSSHNATSCQNFAVESRRWKQYVSFALRSSNDGKSGMAAGLMTITKT